MSPRYRPDAKKQSSLLAEQRPRPGIVQKINHASYPVGAVKIVHHGKDFHPRIFRLQKGHHAIVNRKDSAALHNVKEFIRLFVDALQSSIGIEHVQPVGIQDVDLAGIGPQR